MIRTIVRHDQRYRLPMTAPGAGCMTAISYVVAVERPNEFRCFDAPF